MNHGDAEAAEIRDRASALAREDSEAAAGLAKTIENPWYRCQALAHAARHAPEKDVEALARAAFEAAAEAEDAYQQVGASAWPIRALLERDRRDLALQLLEIALAAVPRIEPNASRAEALMLLLHAAFEASESFRRGVVFALADLRDRDPHWRVVRALRDALELIDASDPEFAARIRSGQGDDATPTENGPSPEPRRFFC